MFIHESPAFPPLRTVAVFGADEAIARWSSRQAAGARILSNPSVAEALAADHAVVLRGHSVEQSGRPEEVRRHPVGELALKAFGPVNTFRGRLEFRMAHDGGAPVFCSIQGEPAKPLAGWLSPALDPKAQVPFFARVEDTEVAPHRPFGPRPGPYAVAKVAEALRQGADLALTLEGEAGGVVRPHPGRHRHRARPNGVPPAARLVHLPAGFPDLTPRLRSVPSPTLPPCPPLIPHPLPHPTNRPPAAFPASRKTGGP